MATRKRVLRRDVALVDPTHRSSAKEFTLCHQLDAAALSIVANIAEGFIRRGRKEFSQFIRIASASNGESQGCCTLPEIGFRYLKPN